MSEYNKFKAINSELQNLHTKWLRNIDEEYNIALKHIDSEEGKALLDARAKMGFAGFGISGASIAMETDIRNKFANLKAELRVKLKNEGVAKQLDKLSDDANKIVDTINSRTSTLHKTSSWFANKILPALIIGIISFMVGVYRLSILDYLNNKIDYKNNNATDIDESEPL